MNNNDILRRTRYILDLKDNQITKIFKHVGVEATEQQVNHWLKREDEPGFVALTDENLIDFLDALIIEKRGKKDGPAVRFKQSLDNNLILMKLKIAFHLKAEEALDVMSLAGFKISKHEFSALFRKKDHKHYRACKNQMLRKFMKGLQIKYRGQKTNKPSTPIKDADSTAKSGKLSLNKRSQSQNTINNKTKHKPQKAQEQSKPVKSTEKKSAAQVWKIPKKKD